MKHEHTCAVVRDLSARCNCKAGSIARAEALVKQKQCAERGHAGVLEYGNGKRRCDNCGAEVV